MLYLAKAKIRHNGEDYAPGDTLPELTQKEAQRLLNLGDIEGVVLPEEDGDEITPEQFSKLQSDPQKECLLGLGIEPASNATERLKQYTDWYDQYDDPDA
ncbi:hypothetical protein PV433_27385 [Paenibacillus sp. GYB004]|uniref:DUF7210 family protein n=1 Tax=Paenibacillus sp. GYB004 TaxID=2994393 RepID=UPI002F96B519